MFATLKSTTALKLFLGNGFQDELRADRGEEPEEQPPAPPTEVSESCHESHDSIAIPAIPLPLLRSHDMLQAPPALPPEEPKRKKSRWDEAKHGWAMPERIVFGAMLISFYKSNIKSLNRPMEQRQAMSRTVVDQQHILEFCRSRNFPPS